MMRSGPGLQTYLHPCELWGDCHTHVHSSPCLTPVRIAFECGARTRIDLNVLAVNLTAKKLPFFIKRFRIDVDVPRFRTTV
jgi:hypothetical protein